MGPIPEGAYTVDPANTLSLTNIKNVVDFAKWILKSPSWGMANTKILSSSGKNQYSYGRSSSYIHGGFWYGSAGCIDLTQYNDQFHAKFLLHKKKMNLRVKY